MAGKAILIGNGVTSQLIDEYKDVNMIKVFKRETDNLYFEINELLNPFRQLVIKDEKNIIELLGKYNIEFHHFYRYFIEQNLILELYKNEIESIETLLKVAHLFSHFREFDYKTIINVANRIYYNGGNKGLNSINNYINAQKFKEYICGFDYVFTTNFDTILDDVYQGDVYHLHGGFNYECINKNNSTWINRIDVELPPEKAHLIWGRNAKEKEDKSKGGFSFPISFPLEIGSSILENYIGKLENGDFTELHVWGYSGLNDNHINSKIKQNNKLSSISVYVDPSTIGCQKNLQEREKLFLKNSDMTLKLISWDVIWNSLK